MENRVPQSYSILFALRFSLSKHSSQVLIRCFRRKEKQCNIKVAGYRKLPSGGKQSFTEKNTSLWFMLGTRAKQQLRAGKQEGDRPLDSDCNNFVNFLNKMLKDFRYCICLVFPVSQVSFKQMFF